MKTKEIREKQAADLGVLEEKLREELASLKIQHRAGRLAETSKMKGLKKDIARVLTISAQKQKEGRVG